MRNCLLVTVAHTGTTFLMEKLRNAGYVDINCSAFADPAYRLPADDGCFVTGHTHDADAQFWRPLVGLPLVTTFRPVDDVIRSWSKRYREEHYAPAPLEEMYRNWLEHVLPHADVVVNLGRRTGLEQMCGLLGITLDADWTPVNEHDAEDAGGEIHLDPALQRVLRDMEGV